MTGLHVNIAYPRMTAEGFAFLAQQDLHPEFYFCGDSIDTIERDVIEGFKKLVETKNFRSTLHAPFYDLNIGSRDRSIRIASLERLFWALETAAILGSKIVVVHPGYSVAPGDTDIDSWLKRAELFLNKLIEHAASLKIKIAFENIYDNKPDYLCKLLQNTDASNTGICFDVGHYNIFSQIPMNEWFARFGSRIYECHLHDNDKSTDQHKAMGDGNIDYRPLIEWYNSLPAEQKPVLTLEQPDKNHILKSINLLRSWGI